MRSKLTIATLLLASQAHAQSVIINGFWDGLQVRRPIESAHNAFRVYCVDGTCGGAGGGGGLTDAELRATPVPVSGTFWQATQPIRGVGAVVADSLAIRCVNAANNAFESCAGGGAGGGGLTDAELRATPVPISGTVTANAGTGTFLVGDGTGPLTVDGTVGISGSVAVTGTFWQATQPVSGTFWQANQPVTIQTNATVDVNRLLGAVPGSSNTFPVRLSDGTSYYKGLTDTELRATAVPVSGTFWQATQPVSGTFWQATQPVSLSEPISVDDNGGSITVDGTIACSNCGGTVGTDFQCTMTSTAVASTVVTGCGAPGAGVTRYITDIEYSSSIISTTVNFMTLQYGTGASCATGVTVVWRMTNSVAFLPVVTNMTKPIKLGTNTDLCFLHPGAGTRLINIRGYTAAP